MAVITPPFVQQGGSHPAATFRQMLLGSTGSPVAAFTTSVQPTTGGGGHGVWSPTDLVATQNGTPNMSVNVAAGGCFVRGTEAAAQGVYAAYNDATLNVVVAASDPTNPRRDLLIMRVRDAFYSGASTDVALAIVTGTAAAAPADPTVPANSLVLARISVAAAVTTIVNANIASLTPRASSLGGLIICTSTTRPTGAALTAGLKIYETDTLRLYIWDGVTWCSIAKPSGALVGFTPSLVQGVTPTKTVNGASYQRIGRMIIGTVKMSATSLATANSDVVVGLPVSALVTPNAVIGSAALYDNSASVFYPAILVVASATTARLLDATAPNTGPLWLGRTGSAFALAIDTGDIITYSFMYEADADG